MTKYIEHIWEAFKIKFFDKSEKSTEEYLDYIVYHSSIKYININGDNILHLISKQNDTLPPDAERRIRSIYSKQIPFPSELPRCLPSLISMFDINNDNLTPLHIAATNIELFKLLFEISLKIDKPPHFYAWLFFGLCKQPNCSEATSIISSSVSELRSCKTEDDLIRKYPRKDIVQIFRGNTPINVNNILDLSLLIYLSDWIGVKKFIDVYKRETKENKLNMFTYALHARNAKDIIKILIDDKDCRDISIIRHTGRKDIIGEFCKEEPHLKDSFVFGNILGIAIMTGIFKKPLDKFPHITPHFIIRAITEKNIDLLTYIINLQKDLLTRKFRISENNSLELTPLEHATRLGYHRIIEMLDRNFKLYIPHKEKYESKKIPDYNDIVLKQRQNEEINEEEKSEDSAQETTRKLKALKSILADSPDKSENDDNQSTELTESLANIDISLEAINRNQPMNLDNMSPMNVDNESINFGHPESMETRQHSYKFLHMFIFDFNQDAIPCMVKAMSEKFLTKTYPSLGCLKLKITIIEPTSPIPISKIIVPKYDDDKMDDGYREMAKNANIVVNRVKQENFLLETIDKEITIFIGETVNCGITSKIARMYGKNKDPTASNGSLRSSKKSKHKKQKKAVSDNITKQKKTNPKETVNDKTPEALSEYHISNLKWVRDIIKPDIIISENHTFDADIRKKIDETLNSPLSRTKYFIYVEDIDHTYFTDEKRTRKYLIASKDLFLPTGYYEKDLFEKTEVKMRKEKITNRIDLYIEEVSKDLGDILKKFTALPEKELRLLNDILLQYSSAFFVRSPNYTLAIYRGYVVLFNKSKYNRDQEQGQIKREDYIYYLEVSGNNDPKFNGIVFLDQRSCTIKLVRKDYFLNGEGMIELQRFEHDKKNRACGTITSLMTLGQRDYGSREPRRRDVLSMARAHGCSKPYAVVIAESLKRYKPFVQNAYIGHIWSSKILSRVIVATIYKYIAKKNKLTEKLKDFPIKFGPIRTLDEKELEKTLTRQNYSKANFKYDQDKDICKIETTPKTTTKCEWIRAPIQRVIEFDEYTNLLLAQGSEYYITDHEEELIINSEINKVITENKMCKILQYITDGPFIRMDEENDKHQIEGVEWMLKRRINGTGGILADEMGVGKTIQAVLYIALRHLICRDLLLNPGISVIVVPNRVINHWIDNFEWIKKNVDIPYNVLTSEKKYSVKWDGKNRIKEAVVINPELPLEPRLLIVGNGFLAKFVENFKEIHFDTLIVDESHEASNPESNMFQNLYRINAKHVFCLTGTPIENRRLDFVTQIQLIDDEVCEYFEEYPENREEQDQWYGELVAEYMLRRTKEDVYKNMPKLTPLPILLKSSRIQKRLTEIIKNNIVKPKSKNKKRTRKDDNEIELCNNEFFVMTSLLQVADSPLLLNQNKYNEIEHLLTEEEIEDIKKNSPKVEKFLEIVKKKFRVLDDVIYNPDEHRPIMVVSKFNRQLDMLADSVREINLPVLKLYNLQNSEILNQGITDFGQGKYAIVLINLKMATGINLQRADMGILFEPWWNPQAEAQAEARIYRRGQERDVTIIRFIMKDTNEEKKVIPCQDKKKGLFEKFIEKYADYNTD